MTKPTQLTGLQLEILQILWSEGEATTQEVFNALKPTRDLALTTVATLLARLEKRGILTHRREGRQYVFSALVSRGDVRRSKVVELVESLFGGDPAELVSHLVGSTEVGPDELSRIRELVDAADSDPAGSP